MFILLKVMYEFLLLMKDPCNVFGKRGITDVGKLCSPYKFLLPFATSHLFKMKASFA